MANFETAMQVTWAFSIVPLLWNTVYNIWPQACDRLVINADFHGLLSSVMISCPWHLTVWPLKLIVVARHQLFMQLSVRCCVLVHLPGIRYVDFVTLIFDLLTVHVLDTSWRHHHQVCKWYDNQLWCVSCLALWGMMTLNFDLSQAAH